MLWFGLVSRVGASYRVNLTAPFPLGWTCPRKIDYEIMLVKLTSYSINNLLQILYTDLICCCYGSYLVHVELSRIVVLLSTRLKKPK